jgi:hypothetical protein
MKVYSDKSNCRRAAKRALAQGDLNAEPRESVDFQIIEQDGGFAWVVPASVQASATDFEVAEAMAVREEKIIEMANEMQAEATGGDAEFENRPAKRRKARNPRVLAPIDQRPDVMVGEVPKAENLPEPAPELPTAFVPDVDAGEIASAEYGMLTTRERAGEAAEAAGVSDPVISQTARGMWVWRTSALNTVWRESQKQPAQREKAKAAKDEKPQRAASGLRGSRAAKLEQTVELLRRPEGATREEVAALTGWSIPSAGCRITTDVKITLGHKITAEKVEGRGKVYRIAA